MTDNRARQRGASGGSQGPRSCLPPLLEQNRGKQNHHDRARSSYLLLPIIPQ